MWGITSILWRDSISTVEAIQYCGGITSVHVGESISTMGIASVLWRLFSTVEGTVGDSISTAEK